MNKWLNEWTWTPDSLVVNITRSAALSSLGFPTKSSASPVVPPKWYTLLELGNTLGIN